MAWNVSVNCFMETLQTRNQVFRSLGLALSDGSYRHGPGFTRHIRLVLANRRANGVCACRAQSHSERWHEAFVVAVDCLHLLRPCSRRTLRRSQSSMGSPNAFHNAHRHGTQDSACHLQLAIANSLQQNTIQPIFDTLLDDLTSGQEQLIFPCCLSGRLPPEVNDRMEW